MVYGELLSFKGDIMLTRIFLKIACIFIMHFTITSVSHGNEIASEPIIEGKSIAGLNIGDTEDKVISVLSRGTFKLYGVEGKDDKLISFGDMTEEGGLGINVFLSDGTIVTIEVITAPTKGKHFYHGKTKKGLSFGDSFQVVEKLYGEPYEKWGNIYWYKDEGIMFGIVGLGIEALPNAVNNITIMLPNSELIYSIKGRGLH